jgi:hypothetical protein
MCLGPLLPTSTVPSLPFTHLLFFPDTRNSALCHCSPCLDCTWALTRHFLPCFDRIPCLEPNHNSLLPVLRANSARGTHTNAEQSHSQLMTHSKLYWTSCQFPYSPSSSHLQSIFPIITLSWLSWFLFHWENQSNQRISDSCYHIHLPTAL